MEKFAEVLRKKIREDMNRYCDDMANGACSTLDQYREMVGVIKGLGMAEAYLVELLTAARKAADNE